MTATDTQPVDVPEDEWRGRVKDSQNDDLPIDESLPRRREARALLGSLLWPYRLTVALLALVVVVENVARLSVPLLVQRGIDHGIPPILSGGSAHTLMVIVGVLGGVVLIQAISRMFFLQRSGRIGQKVLLELRRRVFRHFQRLGHRVPRAIHVGPRGEPVDQRRRGDPGHAGDRLRQPDHRRAHADRHVDSACRRWTFGSA